MPRSGPAMTLLRPLHLILALIIPAISAIAWGSLLKLCGRPPASIAKAMTRVVGCLGPRLAGLTLHCEHPQRLNTGPAVFIFNHQSGLDPVIVAALISSSARQGGVTGVAKQSLAHNPLLGPLLRLTGSLFVTRGEGWEQQLLPQATARMAVGCSIVIAPEGTRSYGKGLRVGSFRLGAFAIARHCQIPIVPIVIHNSGTRLPPRSAQLRSGPVYVSVLEPYKIDPELDLQQAATKMEHTYDDCLAQGFGADIDLDSQPRPQ